MIIGVDPGASGGVAIVGEDCEAWNCPPTVADKVTLLRQIGTGAKAIIEAVHSFPGQGVASTFKFGKGFGEWLGILAALNIPYQEISPQRWIKYFGTMPKDKTKRKNHLKHLAQQRFPEVKVTLKTADAILLAVYGQEVTW